MNCPKCHQPVGNDQHGFGAWEPIHDAASGRFLRCERLVAISCGHCGISQATEDDRGRIIRTGGPYANTRDIRRLSKMIPSERLVRRIPA